MTEFAPPPDDQDDLDFAKLMKGVTPLEKTRADLGPKATHRDASVAYRRLMAAREPEQFIDGLSAEATELVESEDELLFAIPGVQIGRLKRLRQGHIPWEQGLDLHGFTVDQARNEVSRFIRDATRDNVRCVLIVHGKAFTQPGQPATLKSCVNDWLRQMPSVVAFCSAQPREGGTGAVYVLLKARPS